MLKISADLENLSLEAAALFAKRAEEAIAARGTFRVALSGGSTPKLLYQKLAEAPFCDRIAWKKIQVFWGDERHVPSDDPQSNYKMTKEALLDRVPLLPENIFPVPYRDTAEASANSYDETLHKIFADLPRFDLVLLGLGTDGHTASLFPGTDVLNERKKWVSVAQPQGTGVSRVTLTYPVLNNAAMACFLVAGADKASILCAILENCDASYPAASINPHDGELTWIVDQAAAASLSKDFMEKHYVE
jgi:6-phosphogluconolactonase